MMRPSIVGRMEVEPILVSVTQACQMISIGSSGLYELLGAGLIKGVKRGSRTLLVVESLKAYVRDLPPVKVAPPRMRKPQHIREAEMRAPPPKLPPEEPKPKRRVRQRISMWDAIDKQTEPANE